MLSYLRTLIEFVAAYPHVAYGLVFLAALSEALPVIGVVVPGSVIILAVSALVPTGAVALWPLLVWATIGAIVGDGFSYWLGRRYERDILLRWPFSRYPQVAVQSEAFFQQHGGKSVFLGRFIPALRAFVPLFAGILHMPARRFYISNVLSALCWAPAHIFPGVVLGASLALAGAVAGGCAAFVLTLRVVLWLVAGVAGYAVRRGPPFLIFVEERLRLWAGRKDTWMRRELLSLLDPARKEARALVILAAILVGAVWIF